MRESVDFIIIGFQGCGTTTLFQHLRKHPQIFMPFNKECNWEKGMDKILFMSKYFPKDYKNKTIGHATPSFTYSVDMADITKKYFPNAKLVAITRPRHEQIRSSWRGRVRRGDEFRSLEECLNDQFYIDRADFNSILKKYKEYYKNDLLELKLSDLKDNPESVMNDIHEFLKIKEFQSPALGREYNAGLISPNKLIRVLKKIPGKQLISSKIRSKIWWFLEIKGRKFKK